MERQSSEGVISNPPKYTVKQGLQLAIRYGWLWCKDCEEWSSLMSRRVQGACIWCEGKLVHPNEFIRSHDAIDSGEDNRAQDH